MLTFSGYLKAEKHVLDPEDEPYYLLTIPNREVRRVYTSTFREWMTDRMGGESAVERLPTSTALG